MLSVKQGGIKFHFFKVFGMTRPGIEPIGEHSNRWANVPVDMHNWISGNKTVFVFNCV